MNTLSRFGPVNGRSTDGPAGRGIRVAHESRSRLLSLRVGSIDRKLHQARERIERVEVPGDPRANGSERGEESGRPVATLGAGAEPVGDLVVAQAAAFDAPGVHEEDAVLAFTVARHEAQLGEKRGELGARPGVQVGIVRLT